MVLVYHHIVIIVHLLLRLGHLLRHVRHLLLLTPSDHGRCIGQVPLLLLRLDLVLVAVLLRSIVSIYYEIAGDTTTTRRRSLINSVLFMHDWWLLLLLRADHIAATRLLQRALFLDDQLVLVCLSKDLGLDLDWLVG